METPIQDLQDLQDLQDKSGGAVAPSCTKVKRASQMASEFEPKESHRVLAAELGVDLERAFKKFCDYHTSRGSKFVDWDRALNTWLRKEQEFGRGAREKPPTKGMRCGFAQQNYTAGLEPQGDGSYGF